MKKLQIILIFITEIFVLCSCQNTTTISISNPQKNQEQIQGIVEDEGSILMREEKWEEAVEYYLKKLEDSIQDTGEKSASTNAYFNKLGDIYCNLSNYDTAIEYYSIALNNSKELNDDSRLVIAYTGLANAYRCKKEFDTAVQYVEKGMELAKRVFGEDSINHVDAICISSYIYSDKGNYEEALELGLKALNIVMKINETEDMENTIGTCYMNLGRTCFLKDDLENSQIYYEKALKIYKNKWGDESFKTAECYLVLGKTIAKENPEVAYQYFEKAITVFEKNEQYVGYRAVTLAHITQYYDSQGDSEKAMQYAVLTYRSAETAKFPLTSYKEYIKKIYSNMETGNKEDFDTWFKNNVTANSSQSGPSN